jgi:hypothetical protein
MTFWQKIKAFLKGKKASSRHCNGPCKHSLHIGINNYPGSANDLRGCVNDANGWEELLRDQYGFKTKKLLDNQATYRAVVRELVKMVEKAKPNSHTVITFSGHGTNVRDVSGDEQDKRDEALCLYDRLLIDDQLRDILGKLPKGAHLTFISDSCHSGTVTRSFLNTLYDENAPKPRYLPPEDDEEAFEISAKSVTKKILTPQEDMNEVLITGCNPAQYSYDAYLNNKFQGAMSCHALKIIKDNTDLTYEEFYALLRSKLPSRNFPQTPQLEGSEVNKKRKMFS